MIISTLVSFLGGSVFRMLWGEISSFLNKKQDHDHEMARMTLQGTLDASQFERSQAAIKLQADLGVKTIQVQAEAYAGGVETDAWLEAVKGTTKIIGVWWVDAWNGVIRPAVATWAVIMITIDVAQNDWVLSPNGWDLCAAALGIYLADRALFKRGK